MNSQRRSSNYLKMVAKTFSVVESMSQARAGVRVSDLSRRLNQPKATVFRILYTLTQLGYVRRDPHTEIYLLTDRASWGNREDIKDTLKRTARPFLGKLVALFEETVNLGLLEQGRIYYLEIVEGTRAIRMAATPNTYAPIHATALGKSILAFLDWDLTNQMLTAGPLTKYTDHTITSPTILLRQLRRVRKHGYAVDYEETEKGLRCVAAPIFNSEGKPFAAISVSGPTSRIRNRQIRQICLALRRVTKTISAQLGHPCRTSGSRYEAGPRSS